MPTCPPRSRVAVLAMWAILAFPAVASSAGPEIFLREEPETYLVIDKLGGMGYLPGLMTGDRGLEAREVAREADKVDGTGDPFADGMLRFLRLGAARRYDFRLRAGLEHSDDGRVPPNAQGLPVSEGGGLRAGGFFRAAPAGWLALQGRGEFLWGFDGDTIGRIEETSIRLGWPQATLEAGRFSVWWGPGRHGSLLLTTNAEPLWGARLRNPRPIPVGWWLKFLGNFQYDLFAARMESKEQFSHSILVGTRFAVRPAGWLEFGVSRVLHYGGEGADESLSEFFTDYVGSNEPSERSNSLGGFDLTLTLPFAFQPVQVYWERANEAFNSRLASILVPWDNRFANLLGIYLPKVLGISRLDLRVEYADNFSGRAKEETWYRHARYPHSYRGQYLAHHMGSEARDLFLEAHYFLLPSSYLEANADFTRRHFPGPEREETWRIGGAFVAWLTRNFRLEGRAAYERISNENGVAGRDATDAVFQAALSYQYR